MMKVSASNGNVTVNDTVAYAGKRGIAVGKVVKIVKVGSLHGDTEVRVYVRRDEDGNDAIVRNPANILWLSRPAPRVLTPAWPPFLNRIKDGDGDTWHALQYRDGMYGLNGGDSYVLDRDEIAARFGIDHEYHGN